MLKYILRRLVQAIPVLFGISILTFGILKLAPGGATAKFTQNVRITPEQIEAFKRRWGLDDPIWLSYLKWLGVVAPEGESTLPVINALPGGTFQIAGLKIDLPGGKNGILHGDFGFSINDGQPVSEVIGTHIWPTLILAGTAYIIWITIALFAGVYAAVKRYSLFDSALTIFNYVGYSLPTFWLGIMLYTIFSQGTPFKWLPAGGMWSARTVPAFGTPDYWAFFGHNPFGALGDLASHLVLPVITLVVVNIAFDSRFIRASMLDSLNQDFVKTARAKGVPERTVIFRHALRNALLPVVTNIGLEIPFLFTGAVVTETIFSWPGMGRQFIIAVGHVDYPVLMGILIVTAGITVGANLIADIAYAVVDPRVQYD
jgi:peptide/nickel transport system permease protein